MHLVSVKHKMVMDERRRNKAPLDNNNHDCNNNSSDSVSVLHNIDADIDEEATVVDERLDESCIGDEEIDLIALLENSHLDDDISSPVVNLMAEKSTVFAPYSSWPMLYLRQWKLTDGKLLSQTSFNTLLQLLFKLVKEYGSEPSLWPRNFQQIQKCEKQHLVKKTKVIDLESKGKLVMLPVIHVTSLMFKNKEIFNNLHFNYDEEAELGPLWTGKQWLETQSEMEQRTPGAKLFPLLAYSDKSRVLRTRKGHVLHPIVVAPAGVPREVWKRTHNKYTIGYVSAKGDLNEAITQIVKEFAELERGHTFYDPQGSLLGSQTLKSYSLSI